jgi:hypothetical protein
MKSGRGKKEQPEAVRRLMDMGRRLLGGETKKPALERRAGMRVELSLAIRVSVGEGDWKSARLRDVNLTGLSIEPAGDARVGQTVAVQFEGYPDVAPAFSLAGKVSRIIEAESEESEDAMAIRVDRSTTSQEALKNYRILVLHYVRHRPLLEDVDKGYFEGRCSSCGWVGRVGRLKPQCSHCGGSQVAPV